MLTENELQAYILDHVEQEQFRYSYAYEAEFIRQVQEGDVKDIEEQLKAVAADKIKINERIPKMAKKKLKHMEYMACAAITLFSRAAIAGGLETLVAYSMADLYLQKLTECTTEESISMLTSDVRLSYAKQVRKVIEERSRFKYIEECKSYINNHLNKAFTLDDVAENIGIDKYHLSKQFTKEQGESIMKYTRKKRIEASKNLLKYSNESISNISSYLCFASQSHFGRVFKEIVGTSPKQFRDAEKAVDFRV